MAIDDVRMRLRHQLEEMLGVDEAAMLMDRPPGSWGDLVTRDHLDRRFAEQDARFDLKLEALEHRLIGVVHESLRHERTALGQELGVLREDLGVLRGELGVLQRELRSQTWRLLTAVLASMSVLTAMFGVIVVVATR